MPQAPKTLFVINTHSGSGAGRERWLPAIEEYFKKSPEGYEWYEMAGENDDESLRHYVATWQPERVVAVGGDGTLKFVAENMLRSHIAIGFLPAGSANGMARELNLPPETQACLQLALEGTPRSMDVVCINGHFSLHLSDLGLNAQLVKHFEDASMRGMLGYSLQVFKVMRGKRQMQLTIECNGQTLHRHAWMAVIANARTYGTGAEINPGGSLYDGRFELVLFKRLWLWELVRMMLKRKTFDRKKTEIISTDAVKITAKAPAFFQVDGEYVGEEAALDVKIEKGAIAMVGNPQGAGS